MKFRETVRKFEGFQEGIKPIMGAVYSDIKRSEAEIDSNRIEKKLRPSSLVHL